MGKYINPGNEGFARILRSPYVDKTGIIGLVNQVIDTPQSLICVSRPRRFGKSYAAQTLCAYYDCSCDSAALFDGLSISTEDDAKSLYHQHLNRYNVICLDMAGIIAEVGVRDVASHAKNLIASDLANEFPQIDPLISLSSMLLKVVELTGKKVFMIIDEWDAPIRQAIGKQDVQQGYLEFLRSLFKNTGITERVFAGVYMTGILPVKKDGSQSALSDFGEFTMLKPYGFARYVGFLEEDVRVLCETHNGSMDELKRWYDGYELKGVGPVYNPNSVMKALLLGECASFWAQSSVSDNLMSYLSIDFDGVAKAAADLLGGNPVAIDASGFKNDLESFGSRDDVLTLLVHLGYLSYDEETRTVRIPNEEVRIEFSRSIRMDAREETVRRLRESDQLIQDTISMNSEAVAAQIERIHEQETTPLFYNDEQALRSVIKLAYFCYKDHYVQLEELPSGTGFADVAYIPRKNSPYPALVVELKWNDSAEAAVEQIRRKRYPDALKDFGGDILLVGISYDKHASSESRKHSCLIERA